MRTRAEINEEVAESNAEDNGNETVRLLQLEVLLDIRDQQSELVGLLRDITTNRRSVSVVGR